MRAKLIYSNYDPATGVSTARIRCKYGTFEGQSKLHPDDVAIESSFAGCQYAEVRAHVKMFKEQIKILGHEIHALENLEKTLKSMKDYNPYCMECRKLRRTIYEKKADQKTLRDGIIKIEQALVKNMRDRESAVKALANKGQN